MARHLLVLFAHPALQKSRVNVHLAKAAKQVKGVTFHDLYEAYPRLDIDVAREKQLLTEHDVVVFQHPFYWYSTPSIVKEWQDLVLEHGWAYGSEGTALQGKRWMHAITTGGSEEAYCSAGYAGLSVRQLLAPLEQTAKLCGMVFLSPFLVHGTHSMDAAGIERHVQDYRQVLEALRDDRVDEEAIAGLPRMNRDLGRVLLQGKES